MPTSIHAFAQIAADHGGIDPTDLESVQKWYLEILPTLSPEQHEALLETLLDQECVDHGDASSLAPSYPREVRLPRLDEARRVPLPWLAEGVVALLKRLLRSRPSAD